MHPMLNIAVRAALAGAGVIVRYIDRVDAVRTTSKGVNDFVSDVDHESEQRIIDTIRKAYPDHSVLAEESGERGKHDYQWIIDPLDGTTNFLHAFPHVSISIAIKYKGIVEHGLIFDPLRQEMFTATRGGGAQLDDRRIRVGKRTSLEGALLCCGFEHKSLAHLDDYLSTVRAFRATTAGLRETGSCALDLAYVAAGRLDGYFELGLSPWDVAAGALIVREAGGIVSDLNGGDTFFERGNVLAASPRIHAAMLKEMKPLAKIP